MFLVAFGFRFSPLWFSLFRCDFTWLGRLCSGCDEDKKCLCSVRPWQVWMKISNEVFWFSATRSFFSFGPWKSQLASARPSDVKKLHCFWLGQYGTIQNSFQLHVLHVNFIFVSLRCEVLRVHLCREVVVPWPSCFESRSQHGQHKSWSHNGWILCIIVITLDYCMDCRRKFRWTDGKA